MCGLLCWYGKEKNLFNEDDFNKALSFLKHRGPDNTGVLDINVDKGVLKFGHQRLSIIDLSSFSNQPLKIDGYTLIFNGEIYNFNDLRTILIGLGHTFTTKGDSEVVLRSYIEWGVDFVKRLNGMFTICIHDSYLEKIFTFRDRSGVKPCYIRKDDSFFGVSSELKPLVKGRISISDLDKDAISSYFRLGYILGERTLFKNIDKLPPASFAIFCIKTHTLTIRSYWDLNMEKQVNSSSYFDIVNNVRELLFDSVSIRLVSDVPVGLFLRGGIDSSLIAGIIKKLGKNSDLKTYTIGFCNSKFDETLHAEKIAKYLGFENKRILFEETSVYNTFNDELKYLDEPNGDVSILPLIYLSSIAKKEVSVVFGGDGGDELFGGYSKYESIKFKKKIIDCVSRFKMNTIFYQIFKRDFLKERNADFLDLYYQDSIVCSENLISNTTINTKTLVRDFIKHNGIHDFSNRSTLRKIDFFTFMVNSVLAKSDRSTMIKGLELREPLLDYRLVDYAFSLNDDMIFYKGKLKPILKKIAFELMPKNLLERPKMGFGVPLSFWLRGVLSNSLDFYINRAIGRGLLNPDILKKHYDVFKSGDDSENLTLYYVLIFEKVMDNYEIN